MIYPVPSSIPADGTTEVAAALAAFLASVPNASTVVFPAGAVYRTDTVVAVTGKSDWTIEGNGATFRRVAPTPPALQYPVGNRHVTFKLCSRLTVRDLHVTALNLTSDVVKEPWIGSWVAMLAFEHGFEVLGCTDVTLGDLSTFGTYGDGIYLSSSFDPAPPHTPIQTSGVQILGGRIERNGRMGISPLASHVLIDGVHVVGSRRSAIDMEPNTPAGAITDVEICDSILRAHLTAISAVGNADVDDVNIHHDWITSSAVPIVWADSVGHTRDRWKIVYNQLSPNSPLAAPGPAFRLYGAHDFEVGHNIIPFVAARRMTAVKTGRGSTGTVGCNWFPGAAAVYLLGDTSPMTVTETDNALGASPPACLDPATVGPR